MPSASWKRRMRGDAVVGAADDQAVDAVLVEDEVVLGAHALQQRLAVEHPARDLREVEPVLGADARPPVALDVVHRVRDPAVAQQHHLQLVRRAVLLAGGVVDPLPLLHDVDVVQRVGRPRAAEAGGAADAGLGHRAHPQLGVLRQRREVALDREVLAGVVERLPRPQALQDLDRLLEARHLRLRVQPEEARTPLGKLPEADAELEPAAGEHVDHRRVLGDVDRDARTAAGAPSCRCRPAR